MASMHLANVFPGHHGGTLLFGPQRCGNDVFRRYYNDIYGLVRLQSCNVCTRTIACMLPARAYV